MKLRKPKYDKSGRMQKVMASCQTYDQCRMALRYSLMLAGDDVDLKIRAREDFLIAMPVVLRREVER